MLGRDALRHMVGQQFHLVEVNAQRRHAQRNIGAAQVVRRNGLVDQLGNAFQRGAGITDIATLGTGRENIGAGVLVVVLGLARLEQGDRLR